MNECREQKIQFRFVNVPFLCGKGVMGEAATAMRDVMFYPYHEFIDNVFNRYKNTLPPYQLTEVRHSCFKISNYYYNNCIIM